MKAPYIICIITFLLMWYTFVPWYLDKINTEGYNRGYTMGKIDAYIWMESIIERHNKGKK